LSALLTNLDSTLKKLRTRQSSLESEIEEEISLRNRAQKRVKQLQDGIKEVQDMVSLDIYEQVEAKKKSLLKKNGDHKDR